MFFTEVIVLVLVVVQSGLFTNVQLASAIASV